MQEEQPKADPLERLFRGESGRMIAVLTRLFGVHNMSLAEDVVQDAFARAVQVWKFHGVPENPSAWLMTTAKNRALDVLRRERTARTFAPELTRFLESEWTLVPALEEQFAPDAVEDDLLRMMFTCCHPRLAEEAQITLILHILCGFSAAEVAGAFMATRAAIEKRITRAKKTLAASQNLFDITSAEEFSKRLPAVQRALYLLFNEGYHGASSRSAVRAELCGEALRLARHLREHPRGATPSTYALSALFCLHAARLPGRIDAAGELHSLLDQDRSRWDRELIVEGQRLLDLSATGSELTEYHVEAAIAWLHASARSVEATEWGRVVALYDMLLQIRPSPVVALNRAIAVAQHEGAAAGLEALRAVEDRERLAAYPFYPAALGELELRLGRRAAAREHFAAARALARNPAERHFLEQRMAACALRNGASLIPGAPEL
jgi:RNA polymerase sigma-70 factor (ECF subfamily)